MLVLQASLALCILAVVCFVLGWAVQDLVRWRPAASLAPVIGLATMVVLASSVVLLPGHGVTAAVVVGAATAVGAWRLRGSVSALPRGAAVLVASAGVSAVVVLVTAVPFVASGRLGIPGTSLSNDLAFHFLAADNLAAGRPLSLASWLDGYPLGGHAVLAVTGSVSGGALPASLALLVLVPVAIALAVLPVFWGRSRVKASATALAAGCAYPLVIYTAEGAFKEPVMAALVLGVVLVVRRARRSGATATSAGVVTGLLAAAMAISYGVSAIVLSVGVIGLLLVVALATRSRAGRSLASRSFGVASITTVLIATAPHWGGLFRFGSGTGAITGDTGNLLGYLPWQFALGLWPSRDFRVSPVGLEVLSPVAFTMLSVLGVAAVLLGIAGLLHAREGEILATTFALGGMCMIAFIAQGPYLAAKALVIAAPLMALLGMCGLFLPGAHLAPAAAVVSGLFLAAVLWSGLTTLSYMPVGSLDSVNALGSFRDRVVDREVLLLPDDDYGPWALQGSRVTPLYPYNVQPAKAILRAQSTQWGPPADWSAVRPADLRRFDFVVGPRPEASPPSAGWRAVAASGPYALFAPTGADSPPAPTPECDVGTARGTAASPSPPPAAWERVGLPSFPPDGVGLSFVPPGETARASLRVPAGSWYLAMRYQSSDEVAVSVEGTTRVLSPAMTSARMPTLIGAVDATSARIVRLIARPREIGHRLGGMSLGPVGAIPCVRRT
jgi:hypothetical protein